MMFVTHCQQQQFSTVNFYAVDNESRPHTRMRECVSFTVQLSANCNSNVHGAIN